ncbi:MAG: glycosyltransferase family 39 protein, partial [bacterium]
ALWLWCRNGATSSIRIVASGDEVKAYFNGKLIAEGRDAGLSREGGIGFWYEHGRYWGFPVPQAIESVRVTDNDSGALLFEQYFSRPLSGIWTEQRGLGKPFRRRPVLFCTGFKPWRDYTLDLRVRSCMIIEVAVRYQDPRNYVRLLARPFLDVDSGLAFVINGVARVEPGGIPYCPLSMVVKSVLCIFVYCFPWCVLALAALGAGGVLLGFVAGRSRVLWIVEVVLIAVLFTVGVVYCYHFPWCVPALAALGAAGILLGLGAVASPRALRFTEVVFIVVLFIGGFTYLSWITCTLLDGIPHVQDSVVYNFQARTLIRGAIYAPSPPVLKPLEFPFLLVRDGKWFGFYPWGHPFLLALGHLAHRPWIIPPLVGASILVLVYLIARELFSREVGAVSALLAFFSPFFQMNAPNFMSHSSASFYLALGIFFLIKACRGGRGWYGFFSGLALGLLFNTRPLNAGPAIVLSFALLLYFAWKGNARWGTLAGFCSGGLLMLAFYLYANYAIMGDPFKPPYSIIAKPIGLFGGQRTLNMALMHYCTMMTYFVMVIFGWPVVFTTGFFMAFLLLVKRDVWSMFLLLVFVGMTLVNILNPSMVSIAHMYGPRYAYEPLFVFVIMAACGWNCVRILMQRGIEVFASVRPVRAKALSWLAHAAFLALPAVLVFGAQQQWLSPSGCLMDLLFTPSNIYKLKGFNHISGETLSKIRDRGIHNALIFLEDREYDWWYYGAVFTLNSPFLDSDIIVARDLGPQENRKVITAFPGRSLYRVNVKRGVVRDY